jgi:hypothetical protein
MKNENLLTEAIRNLVCWFLNKIVFCLLIILMCIKIIKLKVNSQHCSFSEPLDKKVWLKETHHIYKLVTKFIPQTEIQKS